jgi:nucleotide-binding universal stress UspA family protein
MKNILVPTDFSEQANYALDLAHQIALKTSAKIKLLHVLDLPGGSSFDASGEIPQADEASQIFTIQLMKKTKEDINEILQNAKYKDILLEGDVAIGNPYVHISKVIAEQEMDLVVMGTQGASGLEEILVGSNTEKVVRRAKCPVITMKTAADANKIKNIVFASDFRDELSKLAAKLKDLQKLFNATLHIVSINTPNNFETDRHYKKAINAFIEKYKIEKYTVTVYSDEREEDGIIYFAEDIDADMIAIATHGRLGLSHLLSGSLAEDIVNHSRRPVWTYNIRD